MKVRCLLIVSVFAMPLGASLENATTSDVALAARIVTPPAVSMHPRVTVDDIEKCVGMYQGSAYLLGAGANGRIYVLKRNDAWVAYKSLRQEHMQDERIKMLFEREVDIMHRLPQHPNLPELREIVTNTTIKADQEMQQIVGFTTPLYGTDNLQSLIHNEQFKYTLRELHDWAMGILDGLIALRDSRIIHRDIKSINIVFRENIEGIPRTPVIIDFGLANFVELNRERPLSPGMGSHFWVAPEVVGSQPYDFSADAYSFSIVLFEMLARETPYIEEPGSDRLSNDEILNQIYFCRRRPNIELLKTKFPQLVQVLQRCWCARPIRPRLEEIKTMIHEAVELDGFATKVERLRAPFIPGMGIPRPLPELTVGAAKLHD